MLIVNIFAVPLEVNYETLGLMLKFGLAMMGLLLIIWLLAVITPKLAKVIDRTLGRVKIDKGDDTIPPADENDNPYKVYDIYDGAKLTSASRDEDLCNSSDDTKD